jgi:molybdenum cofactor synthesis domain-containing protein
VDVREGDASPLQATVITVSDEVASGADADRGGPVAIGLLQELGLVVTPALVGDDPAAIRAAIIAATAAGARIVVTCGGTGLGPRDNTTTVVRDLLSFEIPGIAEEIRRRGLQHTPQALVSREVAGAIVRPGRPAVFVLAAPGSRGGVRDALGVVGESLRYIIEQLDGAGHA